MGHQGAWVGFGPFVLDRERQTLLRNGEILAIGRRGYSLLEALLEAQSETVTKDVLLERAWPGIVVEEGNLAVQINLLRKTLGARPDGLDWIVTIPRAGYRLLRGEPVASEESPLPSLAVLPFANLGSDPGQDYFADGIVDDLITALARFKSFRVVARNSSFVFKGRSVDIREAAQELGVRYILEGSVRSAGKRLRVTAQLVDGENGTHLWSHAFDGPLDDVFDVQDRITESVATVIEPKIQLAEIERARHERPQSLNAYDFYLRAVQKLDAQQTPENNKLVLDLVGKALALDPGYVPAMGLAAFALEHRVTMGWPDYGPNDRGRSIELARAVLDQPGDDAIALARCALVVGQMQRELPRAVVVIERAVSTNANDSTVVHFGAMVNFLAGNLERAEELYRRTARISATEFTEAALCGLALIELNRGNHEIALGYAERSLDMNRSYNPTHWALIAANAYLGRLDEARRRYRAFDALFPGVTLKRILGGDWSNHPGNKLNIVIEGLIAAGMPAG
jgi:TolB-like protein/Flp pilus assembly protein TadD